MVAYYNEIDPFAAQWLRNLIEAGHIADGVVDERSIEDVSADDLAGFHQCHFFAGIGVWSLALRRAGWPDDIEVWTGSCPCQPFSAAGAHAGFADERHLWPALHHLIRQRRPPVVLGEQVASKDAEPWIDLVQDDLEALGYRFGAIPFPAAGVGVPSIRDRLYWVGDSYVPGSQGHRQLVEVMHSRREVQGGRLATADLASLYSRWRSERGADGIVRFFPPDISAEPDGVAARVGKVRAYGNAIQATAAQVFIECVADSLTT